MSVVLGVDWGRARVGVAVSDESGLLAHPLAVVPGGAPSVVAAALAEHAARRRARRVVLGWPLNMDGTEGESARAVAALAEALRSHGMDVVLRDERLTSWRADAMLSEGGRAGREKKSRRDAAAAALILQGYLDERRGAAS